jgi:hypothetical protein
MAATRQRRDDERNQSGAQNQTDHSGIQESDGRSLL